MSMAGSDNSTWVAKKPLKRLGGMSDALSIAADLGFSVNPPPSQDELQRLSTGTDEKADNLVRVLRDLTTVQRKIADLQVELQGRKEDKNVAHLTHVSAMEKKIETLARITDILKDVIQNKDRIIARLQQPYSLDCIPVEAEYQVTQFTIFWRSGISSSKNLLVLPALHACLRYEKKEVMRYGFDVDTDEISRLYDFKPSESLYGKKQFSELLMKAASDYGSLTESVADFQWSQNFKEPPSVWGEMLRPIPVALASCTRFFEAMSAMRESFATLQDLRVGHSTVSGSTFTTPSKDPAQRIPGVSEATHFLEK